MAARVRGGWASLSGVGGGPVGCGGEEGRERPGAVKGKPGKKGKAEMEVERGTP